MARRKKKKVGIGELMPDKQGVEALSGEIFKNTNSRSKGKENKIGQG